MTDRLQYQNDRSTAHRSADTWVRGLSEGRWSDVLVQLLKSMDRSCQDKLKAGRDDLFCSVQQLKQPLRETVDAWGELEVQQFPSTPLDRDAALSASLQRMCNEGHALFVSDRQRIRSRAFEVLHYLRNLRQRTRPHPLSDDEYRIVDMIKLESVERERPHRPPDGQGPDWFLEYWNEYSDSDFEEIDPDAAAEVLKLEDGAAFEDVKDDADRVFLEFLEQVFDDDPSFPNFQRNAFCRILHSALNPDVRRPWDHIIAAGTGFGKTEAFLFPILYYSVLQWFTQHRREEDGDIYRNGFDAALLYPRRDLCNNQAERLLGYLLLLNRILQKEPQGELDSDKRPIRVAIAHSGFNRDWNIQCPECAEEDLLPRDQLRAKIKAIEDPDSPNKFHFECERCPDEHTAAAALLVHQIKQKSGEANIVVTTIDTLHRRLMDGHGLATLFKPKQRPPRFIVVDEVHIYEGQAGAHAAQILRRTRQRIKKLKSSDGLSPVFVGASATAGQPKELAKKIFGSLRVMETKPTPEEIKISGLEYFFFVQAPDYRLRGNAQTQGNAQHQRRQPVEQATMIQAAFCLQHTMRTPDGPGSKRRVLGFVDSLDLASRLSRNLDDAEWGNLRRAHDNAHQPLFLLRYPRGRPNAGSIEQDIQREVAGTRTRGGTGQVTPPNLNWRAGFDCPKATSGSCHQPPHHLLERCDRYEHGECWYTMATPLEEGWKPLAIQSHRSGPSGRRWGNQNYVSPQDKEEWRLLLSTSALEVGFDHPELIATWQWHAPPSIASFIQRKGRGGRGVRDFPITMVVLGSSSSDTFVFQDHMKWVKPQADDYTSVVDEKNPSIRNQHLVSSIFDYCAANGLKQAYKLDTDELLKAFGPVHQPRLTQWLEHGLGLSPQEVSEKLTSFRNQIKQVWKYQLAPPPDDLPGAKTPAELFSKGPDANNLTRWADRLRDASTKKEIQTRHWIDACLRRLDQQKFKATAVDFYQYMPTIMLDDATLRVPSGTIPTPLGRHVDLDLFNTSDGNRQTIGTETEAAEAALQYFLPGGFKIRYQGKLWMAPWNAVGGRPPRGSVTFAATSSQLRGTGSDVAFESLMEDSPLTGIACQDLMNRLGPGCHIRYVHSLEIDCLGRPKGRSFSLDLNDQRVVSRQDQDAPDNSYELLARDPQLLPQFDYLPIGNQTPRPVNLPNSRGLKNEKAGFFDTYQIDKIHYANLVICYRKGLSTRTIVVKFWDENEDRPLAPTIRLTTQALEFDFDWTGLNFDPIDPVRFRSYWRVFEKFLFEDGVLETGALECHFLIEGISQNIQLLESSAGEFSRCLPEVGVIQQRLTERIPEHLQGKAEYIWCQQNITLIHRLLQRATAELQNRGLYPVLAQTVAAALRRAGARDLNAAPHSLRTLVLPGDQKQKFKVVLYDNIEGGSGNIRSLQQIWHNRVKWLSSLAQREAICPASVTDAVIEKALSWQWSPEMLSQFAQSSTWPADMEMPTDAYQRQRAIQRLRPLVLTPEIAAFNRFARKIWNELTHAFGSEPNHLRFLEKIRRSPAFDPRAEILRKRFIDNNELEPRIRGVQPLCTDACPECLVQDRFHTFGVGLNRNLLHLLIPDTAEGTG